MVLRVYSSPGQKAQVSSSDKKNMSVVCRRRCCRKLSDFFPFPKPLGQFQEHLAQSITVWRGFKFVQMKIHAIFKWEIFLITGNLLVFIKNLFLKNF